LRASPHSSNRPETSSGPSTPRNAAAKAREIQDSQDLSGEIEQSPKKTGRRADPTLTDEQRFRKDLVLLAEALGEEIVDFTPEICGRSVPLFKLWQVVRSYDFGGYERVTGLQLWPKVARFLGFKDDQQSLAANELKACYGEILTDLEEYQEFQSEQLTESQERAMLEAQLLETAARETQNLYEAEDEDEEEMAEEDEDDDLDRPQYSPHLPIAPSSSKRSFGADRTNVDASYKKRQRIDKGKGKELEIPSTPEDVINNTQMPRSLLKPSPLKYSSPPQQEEEEEEDEEEDSSEL
jgi:hypothetical protein